MRLPEGRPFKVILSVDKNFSAIVEDIKETGLTGYLHSSIQSNGENHRGYVVFQSGQPIIACHNQMDEVNHSEVLDRIREEVERTDSDVELRKLSHRELKLFSRYTQLLSPPGMNTPLKLQTEEGPSTPKKAEPNLEDLGDLDDLAGAEEDIGDYLRQVEDDFSNGAAEEVLDSIGLSHMKRK